MTPHPSAHYGSIQPRRTGRRDVTAAKKNARERMRHMLRSHCSSPRRRISSTSQDTTRQGAYAAPYALIVALGRPTVFVVRAYDEASVIAGLRGPVDRIVTYFGRGDAMDVVADQVRSHDVGGAHRGRGRRRGAAAAVANVGGDSSGAHAGGRPRLPFDAVRRDEAEWVRSRSGPQDPRGGWLCEAHSPAVGVRRDPRMAAIGVAVGSMT